MTRPNIVQSFHQRQQKSITDIVLVLLLQILNNVLPYRLFKIYNI